MPALPGRGSARPGRRTATEPDDAGGRRTGRALPQPQQAPDGRATPGPAAVPTSDSADPGSPDPVPSDPVPSDAPLLRLPVAGGPGAVGELFLRARGRA